MTNLLKTDPAAAQSAVATADRRPAATAGRHLPGSAADPWPEDLVARLKRLPEVRPEKVRQMRHLLARGKLDTPERIEGAVRRLMEELSL